MLKVKIPEAQMKERSFFNASSFTASTNYFNISVNCDGNSFNEEVSLKASEVKDTQFANKIKGTSKNV